MPTNATDIEPKGHSPITGDYAERSVVCRFQGRVQARRRSILLPADGYRPVVRSRNELVRVNFED